MLFGLPGNIFFLLKYNVALWIWRSDLVPQFLDLENYREIVRLKVKLFKVISNILETNVSKVAISQTPV